MASGISNVFLTVPSEKLFSIFPPNPNPAFIPPPASGTTAFVPPFDIPSSVYQSWLDARVPLTIAAVYAVSAKALNAYNRSTGKKPWAISQTRLFDWFVVAHNVFLAVYSAWTFWGMLGALRRTMVSPLGPTGLAGFADSMCRMSGPAGYGSAVYYSEETDSWQTYSSSVALDAAASSPLSTDTGRIWNEGLAFYGWIFYLSKFYEVLDTFIILAKGKFSSTLQTYHHAGAMMCMWAGMRYMSPPIWIFVFVNSGIHAMMYTYYTITAFRIRVPMAIKRTLTTLQITQFLVGASLGMAHSFISYLVPVSVSSSETAKSVPSSHASASSHISDSSDSAGVKVLVPCITTTGQTFAIWLNVLYLAPLTYLFMSFFVSSYIRRSTAEGKKSGKRGGGSAMERRLSNVAETAEKAGWEAARGVEREVYGQDGVEEGSAVVDEDLRGNGRVLRSRRA